MPNERKRRRKQASATGAATAAANVVLIAREGAVPAFCTRSQFFDSRTSMHVLGREGT
jgi:hypothetical protein